MSAIAVLFSFLGAASKQVVLLLQQAVPSDAAGPQWCHAVKRAVSMGDIH